MIVDCKLISLKKINDPRGNLAVIESAEHVPFQIKRVYYLYDVPRGAVRGSHGHKKLEQLIIAANGSFDIEIDDGLASKTYHLSDPAVGLYISPMIWRDIKNFSEAAICLVLASDHYDELDYYRVREEFILGQKNEK